MCIFDCEWWNALTPQVRQALISGLITGLFTVLSATVGILVVVYQLRRQAANALVANQYVETMKLKKDLFSENLLKIADAQNAQFALETAIEAIVASVHAKKVVDYQAIQRFSSALPKCEDSTNQLVAQVMRWLIVDGRSIVFHWAFASANKEVARCSEVVIERLKAPSTSLSIQPADVSVGTEELDKLTLAHRRLVRYTQDYTLAMQALLLGDLFPDQHYFQPFREREITLEKHEVLSKQLEAEFRARP